MLNWIYELFGWQWFIIEYKVKGKTEIYKKCVLERSKLEAIAKWSVKHYEKNLILWGAYPKQFKE